MKIIDSLQLYAQLDSLSPAECRREMSLIAEQLWKIPSLSIITQPELGLTPKQIRVFKKTLERRRQGEPLAYILGNQGFYANIYAISPAAMVPRPETECLIDWTLNRFSKRKERRLNVLEVGTGSGVVALSLASQCPHWHITATDISIPALRLAARNASRDGLKIKLRCAHLFPPRSNRYDLILSNPPYIAHHEHSTLLALKHEPTQALVAGTDGLFLLRQLIKQAPYYLKRGGWLILEHSWKQHRTLRRIASLAGYSRMECVHDLAGRQRGLAASYL